MDASFNLRAGWVFVFFCFPCLRRWIVAAAMPFLLGACAAHIVPAGPDLGRAAMLGAEAPGIAAPQGQPQGQFQTLPRQDAVIPASGVFVMPDGVRLPYRAWMPLDMPQDGPWAVVLALHGMNDSRDAWEYPAPVLNAAGIAVIAPDQRGFGESPSRGYWAGGQVMAADAAAMLGVLKEHYPHSRIFAMGESMGGAVLMLTAAGSAAPPVDGYIISAPAVWGRSKMNMLLRGTLWLALHTIPGARLGPGPVHVTASDNRAALIRLGRDPLTLPKTRVDLLGGVVDLMDDALNAAPRIRGTALFLYGGRDELVPKQAMRAAWDRLGRERIANGDIRLAYYDKAYHLLFRDHARSQPTQDVIAWMMAVAQENKGLGKEGQGAEPFLPSGADRDARGRLGGPVKE